MAVEIGTLMLKGRFGPADAGVDTSAATDEKLEQAIEVLRQELLRELDDKMEQAARRAWER